MLYDSSVSKIYESGRTISIASLAVPKFFEMVFVQMLGTVNTIMLSGYSEEAVAATSVANQIQNLSVVILNIIICGMSILMSIELGKNDISKAGQVAGTAYISILIASAIVGAIISVFSEKLVCLMNLEGEAQAIAADYLGIKSRFLFILMSTSYFNNLLICNGYAKYTFVTGITSNILNVAYGYIVLYSGLNLPVDKINALAYSLPITQTIVLVIAVIIYKKNSCPFNLRYNPNLLKKILRLGTPSGLGSLSFTATQVLTTGFMATLGVSVLNAKVYVSNIISYTSKISWSVAQGHSVLTGRYRGKGEYDKMNILYRQNMAIAVLSNTVLSVLVFILYKPLIGIFTDDLSVIALASAVMSVDIIVEIARAVNNIAEQSLNANGDVKTTFIVPLFTCWIFGVLLAYILGIRCGLGLVGCWIGFAVDEVVKATLYSLRWKSGKWKNTNV